MLLYFVVYSYILLILSCLNIFLHDHHDPWGIISLSSNNRVELFSPIDLEIYIYHSYEFSLIIASFLALVSFIAVHSMSMNKNMKLVYLAFNERVENTVLYIFYASNSDWFCNACSWTMFCNKLLLIIFFQKTRRNYFNPDFLISFYCPHSLMIGNLRSKPQKRTLRWQKLFHRYRYVGICL